MELEAERGQTRRLTAHTCGSHRMLSLDPDRLCELTLRDLGSQQLDANPQEIYPTVH
jgi:hypothetical protein